MLKQKKKEESSRMEQEVHSLGNQKTMKRDYATSFHLSVNCLFLFPLPNDT